LLKKFNDGVYHRLLWFARNLRINGSVSACKNSGCP